MTFDARGIRHAVIEVVKTDNVNDIENIAIVEANAAKFDDILFIYVRRRHCQLNGVVEHTALRSRQFNFGVILLDRVDERIIVSFATESLSVCRRSIAAIIGRRHHRGDHFTLAAG